jgi:hypothetical protein
MENLHKNNDELKSNLEKQSLTMLSSSHHYHNNSTLPHYESQVEGGFATSTPLDFHLRKSSIKLNRVS